MIRRTAEIVFNSFKMALQELWKNKLRTFLSLFGVTIGIFCIIGVLATVNSLEQNIQNELKSLGNNTLYLDKWDYSAGGGPNFPFWKYVNRPVPRYDEIKEIKERSPDAKYIAFKIAVNDNVEFSNSVLSGINLYGVSNEFMNIQDVDIGTGRYISESEFEYGSNSFVIGNEVAEKLFGNAEVALGKEMKARGKKGLVIGVFKKQGKTMIGGWNFDESVVMPYKYARNMMDERRSNPLIIIQGKDNISSKVMKENLIGAVRAIHKLSPTQEDDFTLNDINDFSAAISQAFSSLNIAGWCIAALSLVVGMFGVANIMFVTVRERTSQIGLKKAVGSKNRIILTEFLLESAFLCIVGGFIGLTLVFLLTQILSSALNFPVYISTYNMAMAIIICVIVGVVAGFIPASQAARMDPVVAIRSK